MRTEYAFLPGEHLWGGSTFDGVQMPFSAQSEYCADFRVSSQNQTMPFFISDRGRYFWSDEPFAVEIKDGRIAFTCDSPVCEVRAGKNLRQTYCFAMRAHFPSDGRHLPECFFRAPQYNTWMEFTYSPTQEGTLAYARALLENGFAPGVLIIDEGWHGRYGCWDFDRAKFPDPAGMIRQLHDMGFTVMLWVVPVVCADGQDFIRHCFDILPNPPADVHDIFLRTASGEVALIKWWNGYSAVLDMRKACDRAFLDTQLEHLRQAYGVDGFKFDGGNLDMYSPDNIRNGAPRHDQDPHAMNRAWNEFGRRYEYHEFKDSYGCAGHNAIQRLQDRRHRWVGEGIDTLIPSAIAQGLLGYPFICPDMIGGGEWSCTVDPTFHVEEELFVRSAQCSALYPMMQFSWAPWRVLSQKNLAAVRAAAQLHCRMAPYILELVRNSEQSAEPIVRALEYVDPGQGYADMTDEFLLGDDILVAPVVTPGTRARVVTFPAGQWQDEQGNLYEGRTTQTLPAPLEKLLWFTRRA